MFDNSMYDKVTEEYENEGKAIFYMPMNLTEHARNIIELISVGAFSVLSVKASVFNGENMREVKSLESIPEMNEILIKESPSVYSVFFDGEYKGVPIKTTLDYERKNIVFENELNEWFKLNMGSDYRRIIYPERFFKLQKLALFILMVVLSNAA